MAPSRANKGAAGVDDQTLAEIEEQGEFKFIEECLYLLKEGAYYPAPVRRQYISKKDGRQRPLGIPTVRERVIQMATELVIEPCRDCLKNLIYILSNSIPQKKEWVD